MKTCFLMKSICQSVAIPVLIVATAFGGCSHAVAEDDKQPSIDETAPKLELRSYDSGTVNLEEAIRKGPVVVMVLRGNPGYQCPLCTRQVAEFIKVAKDLESLNATVLMVYPGPEAGLDVKANEFLKDTKLPEGFHLLIDPDYSFTNDWHLRWNEPGETAYPSTFVIDKDNKIRFAKISKTHGDRAPVKDVIKSLKKL